MQIESHYNLKECKLASLFRQAQIFYVENKKAKEKQKNFELSVCQTYVTPS